MATTKLVLTNTNNVSETISATAGANVIPRAEAGGTLNDGFINSYITPIKTANAGENLAGGTLPEPVYVPAAGTVFKADANDNTKYKFVGFATSTATTGNPVFFQTFGVVNGFSGLTIGSTYYVQDTAGTIGVTPGTQAIPVGRAVSATQLLIEKKPLYATGVVADLSTSAAANNDVTVTCGFKPRLIVLHYFIQGHSTSAGTAQYLGEKGVAHFEGTTFKYKCQQWLTPDSSGNGLTGDNGYPADVVNAATLLNTPNSTSGLVIGATGSGGIQITVTVNSISTTGFVIRRATVNTDSTARAKIGYEVFE